MEQKVNWVGFTTEIFISPKHLALSVIVLLFPTGRFLQFMEPNKALQRPYPIRGNL